jgi:succinate dehydrogenase / fumarate reductase cytochrome b subunit
MGVTGLLLIGFLITHLIGNLLIYVSPEAYNAYGASLHAIHGFVAVELGLAAVFIIHIWMAISLTLQNRAARPVGYTEKKRESTLSSQTMIVSGLIILAFLIVHVNGLRFGPVETHPMGEYGVTIDIFRNPVLVLLYVVGVLLLSPHLRHGIQSSLRSVGLSNNRYLVVIDKISIALAAILTIGFVSIPVVMFLTKG